ncbi:MATH domain and coiled-coil domain-containing protein At2g05420-like isoform X2 [Juglans microcarpa x Juglans regia]|uniref:MATH domain and coiled-coil domain-containing protein At2g05420-like isoform X2 n=1 Tax=Juglans microcarpa x Juglans regia TaxID=2249226 RepID=UPI001B7E1CDC|nr:MATH domain and coiled-coil domain-containing protein At2g05420-like isoform X2 [Juglans microcarpa x Juglans regia]
MAANIYRPEVMKRLVTRDLPPAHYTFKIESFSKIIKIFPGDKEPKYDSEVFESGGYKWKLSFYPSGRKEWDGAGNISLYLVIEDTDSLPLGWEVNAMFKMFVLDQIGGDYLTIQDDNGKIRRFHAMKTEWGFAQFLPLTMFGDASNGYLLDDSCVFGAEVFVIKCTGKGERMSILSSPITGYCRWDIGRFSAVYVESLSKEFRVGERKWELTLYPRAVSTDDGESYIKLFLSLSDWETPPPKGKLYAEYTLRVRDRRVDGEHVEVTDCNWFSTSTRGYDYPKFLSLRMLKDSSRSLLANDLLVVEAHIDIISVVKKF